MKSDKTRTYEKPRFDCQGNVKEITLISVKPPDDDDDDVTS